MHFLKNVRAIPRDRFLGIYRGRYSSEYTEADVPRNIPRDMFLGLFRGICPSVYSYRSMYICPKTHRSMNVRGNIPTKFSLGIFRGHFDKLVILGISSEVCFLGIPSENSEGFPRKEEIPRNYFRRLVSLVCRRNNDIPKFRRFFPSESLLFSCSASCLMKIAYMSNVNMSMLLSSYKKYINSFKTH